MHLSNEEFEWRPWRLLWSYLLYPCNTCVYGVASFPGMGTDSLTLWLWTWGINGPHFLKEGRPRRYTKSPTAQDMFWPVLASSGTLDINLDPDRFLNVMLGCVWIKDHATQAFIVDFLDQLHAWLNDHTLMQYCRELTVLFKTAQVPSVSGNDNVSTQRCSTHSSMFCMLRYCCMPCCFNCIYSSWLTEADGNRRHRLVRLLWS